MLTSSIAFCDAVLRVLSDTTLVRYSAKANSDFLFSFASGSVGFGVYTEYSSETLQSLLKMEKASWRSYGIFRNFNEISWGNLQKHLPGGKLQLLRSSSLEESIDLLIRVLSFVGNEFKAKQQIEFFRRVSTIEHISHSYV